MYIGDGYDGRATPSALSRESLVRSLDLVAKLPFSASNV